MGPCRPRHGADVQPEAILVKNIIVEMHNSMSVLTDLVGYLRRHDYNGLGNWEERLEPELVDLLMLLATQGPNSIAQICARLLDQKLFQNEVLFDMLQNFKKIGISKPFSGQFLTREDRRLRGLVITFQ